MDAAQVLSRDVPAQPGRPLKSCSGATSEPLPLLAYRIRSENTWEVQLTRAATKMAAGFRERDATVLAVLLPAAPYEWALQPSSCGVFTHAPVRHLSSVQR